MATAVANPLTAAAPRKFHAPAGAEDVVPLPQQPKAGPTTASLRYPTDMGQLPAGLQLYASVARDGVLLPGETLALRLENVGSAAQHVQLVLRCEERVDHQFKPSRAAIAAAEAKQRGRDAAVGVANAALMAGSIASEVLLGLPLVGGGIKSGNSAPDVPPGEHLRCVLEVFADRADRVVPPRESVEVAFNVPAELPPSFTMPGGNVSATGKVKNGIMWELQVFKHGGMPGESTGIKLAVGSPPVARATTTRQLAHAVLPPASEFAEARELEGLARLVTCCKTVRLEYALVVPCGIMLLKSPRSTPWWVVRGAP